MWSSNAPLWTVGGWRQDEVRVAATQTASAAFFGQCLATEDELHAALDGACAASQFEVLQSLPGSYAVVIRDQRAVHVLTDRAGLHPVFHTRFGDGTMFASDALILAALHHANLAEGVNPAALAAAMFLPDLPEVCDQASVFRGVERIAASTLATFTPQQQTAIRPFRVGRERLGAADAAEALRTSLLTAVQRRVLHAGNVSTDLSGGLDSSSIAIMAAQAGAVPVAVTYADPYAINDEDVQFARTIAAADPRLHHVTMTGHEGTLPFTAMDAVPVTDEPSLDAVIIARTHHRLTPALAHNSDVHLTGDGGDVVLSVPGLAYLGDLARSRQRRRLRREAAGWARLRHQPARLVRRGAAQLGATTWPDTIRQLAERLCDPLVAVPARRGMDAQLTWAALAPAAPWGTLRMRRAIANQLDAVNCPDNPRQDSADAVATRLIRSHGAATRGFGQITRALGVAVHAPFLDGQVIDACLAATAADRTTVHQAKPLLAAAFDDLLPPALLARRTKGDYSACEYHGLRANVATLRALLANPVLAELDIVQPDGPREALRLGLAGSSAPMAALGTVIATEVWLRALDTLNPTTWWHPMTLEIAA